MTNTAMDATEGWIVVVGYGATPDEALRWVQVRYRTIEALRGKDSAEEVGDDGASLALRLEEALLAGVNAPEHVRYVLDALEAHDGASERVEALMALRDSRVMDVAGPMGAVFDGLESDGSARWLLVGRSEV